MPKNVKCLAPARDVCGGGILFFLASWTVFAVLFGTYIGLENKMRTCIAPCYDSTHCWTSSDFISSTSSSWLMCVGDASACWEKCTPENKTVTVSNDVDVMDDGSSCRSINRCDDMFREENENVSRCTRGCNRENAIYGAMTDGWRICFFLGLLIVLLSGTMCLNFYREAIVIKCNPWYREIPGRILLYGTVGWVLILVAFIARQIVLLAREGSFGGMGFAFGIIIILTFVLNVGLVLISLVGRCCLGENESVEMSSSDP
jgi:hypothetical protein